MAAVTLGHVTGEEREPVAEAEAAAKAFTRWAWVFRAQFVMLAPFWFVSTEPVPQRAMLTYLAALSIHALVVTYDGKAEAAKARAASFENP